MDELQSIPLLDANKMALKSQASNDIVPTITYSSDPEQSFTAHCSEIAMQAKQISEHDQEQLSGFIFMCNGRTKPQCYMYRVFGLPFGKLEVVKRINPGVKLFLFDFEKKLLYGIYEATSVGTLNLEKAAFSGRFPAQVRFKIYRDCLPLHESSVRHAIEYNCHKRLKFKQELNKQQLGSILSLFRPLTESAPGSLRPMLYPAEQNQNQSMLQFSSSSCVQVSKWQEVQQTELQQGRGYIRPVDPNVTGLQLSYVLPVSEPQKILQGVPSWQQHYFGSQQVQQAGLHQGRGYVHSVDPNVSGLQLSYVLPVSQPQKIRQNVPSQQQHYFGSQQVQQGIGLVHPVDPNVTGLQLIYAQPVSEPQKILQTSPFLQQHYIGSTTNMVHSSPNMVSQDLLQSNYQYYKSQVQQLYAAGNPPQMIPDQYNRYMGIHQQLVMGHTHQVKTVQQQESVIWYSNSNLSPAASHVTPSVLSYMPTNGTPEAANGSFPFAYVSSYAGTTPTHY